VDEQHYKSPDVEGPPPDRFVNQQPFRRCTFVRNVIASWIAGAVVGAILFVPTLSVQEFSALLFIVPFAAIGTIGSLIALAFSPRMFNGSVSRERTAVPDRPPPERFP
jgi:hypothetical protein